MEKIKVVAVTNFLSDYFVVSVIMIFLQNKTHASVYLADSKPYVYSVRVYKFICTMMQRMPRWRIVGRLKNFVTACFLDVSRNSAYSVALGTRI
jgi:hypothetical protein